MFLCEPRESWIWYLLVDGLGVNKRSEGMESKQGGEAKM